MNEQFSKGGVTHAGCAEGGGGGYATGDRTEIQRSVSMPIPFVVVYLGTMPVGSSRGRILRSVPSACGRAENKSLSSSVHFCGVVRPLATFYHSSEDWT